MKQRERNIVFCMGLICAAHLTAIAQKVEYSPLGIGSSIDIGQVVKGSLDEKTGNNPDGEMKILQHTAVYLNQTTTIDDRLAISVGVGGLFFYGYPTTSSLVSRVMKFGPGVGQAQGVYKFGDLKAPTWILQFGFFPFKYNPDAKNLGEYLLRSGTYPGYEVTGGWSTINSALYMASGVHVRGNFLSNKLNADFNVFLEHDLEPQHDFSPSVVLTYTPSSIVDFGAGVEYAHLIPVSPKKTNRSSSMVYIGDSVFADDGTTPGRQFFTFQGIKVMGRAAVNFGALLNNPWIGKDGLKLYSEVAILGVKDYPYYYDDITKRIPVMVGINLPTLGFFDALAFEYEHRSWNFENNINKVIEAQPLWGNANQTPAFNYDPKHPSDTTTAQSNKWSFYAKKQLYKGVSLYAQVASDYLRGIDPQIFLFSDQTITSRPSQWYYLFRLEFGI